MGGMRGRTAQGYWGIQLDSDDANRLGHFYADLLDWPIYHEEPGEMTIAPDGSHAYLAFQTDPNYVRPEWPSEPGKPIMMMHLDVEVSDLTPAVEDAVALGAVVADFQPQENVRVLLDPAGHPFCLYVDITAD